MSNFKGRRIFFALGGGLMSAFVAHAAAQEPAFHITGTTLVTIKTKEILANGSHGSKIIGLLKITPSQEFINRKKDALKKAQFGDTELDYSNGIIPFSQSPGAVDLGMNNTPVLDQGQYGTCVTFSTTAAMDAVLGKGDFISQQCSLELDAALGTNYWDGADYSSQVIDPLKTYGLVQQNKCNATYPSQYAVITLSGYKSRADKTVNAQNINYKYTNGIAVDAIKTALKAGHRVTIGFGLDQTQDPISTEGFDMIVGGTSTTGGLWACSQPSSADNYCGTPNAGHEVVVVGYDDNQQLLKIRNSWNTVVGDDGDFYMTYTYFAAMSNDGTEVY